MCEKSVSSLELLIKFDERFKVTSVAFFLNDFNLLSWELDNCNSKCYTEPFYTSMILSQKIPSWARFLVKITCCIDFGGASSACC